jgi:superfamily I DNA/RNA helicase
VWISDPQKANRADFSSAIRLQTIHHAKGLQYRAVIFMWADLLPHPQSPDLNHDRKLFYVGLTRAAEFLAIVSSGNSVFVDEAINAIRSVRSPARCLAESLENLLRRIEGNASHQVQLVSCHPVRVL